MEDFSKKEIIAFGNDLNTMSSHGLTSKEMNVLMTICLIAKDRGIDEIKLPLSIIKNIADINGISNEAFCVEMKKFYNKIKSLSYSNSMVGEYTELVIFDYFRAAREEGCIELGISSRATYLFNNLSNNFTKMNLKEHNELTLKSSKILYRNLCQYRNTGYWRVDLDEFKRLFGLLETYRTRSIKSKVIDPAIKELENTMNITCQVLKNKRTSAHETIGFEFFFGFKNVKEENSNENIITELIPDNRIPEELHIHEEYKKIIQEKVLNKVILNEYQIDLITNKAIEYKRNIIDMENILNIVLEMKNIRNVMGMILTVIKDYEKYTSSISYSSNKINHNFSQRGQLMSLVDKKRYFELLERILYKDNSLNEKERAEFEKLEKEYDEV